LTRGHVGVVGGEWKGMFKSGGGFDGKKSGGGLGANGQG